MFHNFQSLIHLIVVCCLLFSNLNNLIPQPRQTNSLAAVTVNQQGNDNHIGKAQSGNDLQAKPKPVSQRVVHRPSSIDSLKKAAIYFDKKTSVVAAESPMTKEWRLRLYAFSYMSHKMQDCGSLPNISVSDSNDKVCPACLKEARGRVGGPIDTKTGGYDYAYKDLSVATLAGDITFEHTYSTQVTNTYTTTLGPGWTHSLDTRLIFPNDPGGQAGYVLFKAHSTNRYLFYDSNNDGSYLAPTPGVGFQAVQTRGENGEVNGYQLTDASQAEYRFDLNGKLLEYRNFNGHSIYYVYSANSLKVMDEREFHQAGSGRFVQLTYNPDGSIANVVDHTQRMVSFTYDPNSKDLIAATDVTGQVWSYTYADPNHPHFLTRVTNPAGYIVEATHFDAAGRAIRQFNAIGYLTNTPNIEISYLTNSTTITTSVGGQLITTTHLYDGRQTLVGVDDPANTTAHKVYDTNSAQQQPLTV